jgi:hypothetical protein
MYVSVWQQGNEELRVQMLNSLALGYIDLHFLIYVEKWTTANRRWMSNGIHEDTSVKDPER